MCSQHPYVGLVSRPPRCRRRCLPRSKRKQRVPFSVLAPRKVNGPCMFFPQPWRLTLFMMDGKLLFFSLSLHFNFLFSCFFSSAGCLCCLLCWFCRHCCYSCIFQIFPLVYPQLFPYPPLTAHPTPASVFCLFNHFVI